MKNSKTPVADLLKRAADIIEPEGKWTQGALARTRGGYEVWRVVGTNYASFCMEGACLAAIPPGGLLAAGIKGHMGSVMEHVRAVTPGRTPDWNDAPGRKQSEVVDKLREAAAHARAKEMGS